MRPVHIVFILSMVVDSAPAVLRAQTGNSPRFEAWNLGYTVPPGWQLAQQQGRVHGLTPGAPGSIIYVAPGRYQDFNAVAAELPKAFQALNLTGVPVGAPVTSTIRGLQAMTATYAAQDPAGVPVRVQVTAVLSPHGTGLVVMGLAVVTNAAQIGPAVDLVAQSVVVGGAPVVDQRAVAALRGRWILYSGRVTGVTSSTGGSSRSYEENVEFDGVGRFSFRSSASVSVTTAGSAGSASGANGSSDQGTYTVIGTTLIIRGQQGQASYEVQILADRFIADGKTYLRDQ
ncbi:MAG: hypothetical protein K8S21_12950 [Gemmatimonadetes bacterium]|nr:hypothetical protein [Gemmatimonadota bacterium]